MDTHYEQAEQYILAGNISAAAENLGQVPSFFRSQKQLAGYTELCKLAQSATEKNYKAALDGILQILNSSSDLLKSAIQAQYSAIDQQYRDQLYQTALDHLQAEHFHQAQEYLRQVSEYPYVNELQCYAQAGSKVPISKTSTQLKNIMELLELIPEDYDGPFSKEIPALRTELSNLILDAVAREKAAEEEKIRRAEEARKAEGTRIAALKATGLPYVGVHKLFYYQIINRSLSNFYPHCVQF